MTDDEAEYNAVTRRGIRNARQRLRRTGSILPKRSKLAYPRVATDDDRSYGPSGPPKGGNR